MQNKIHPTDGPVLAAPPPTSNIGKRTPLHVPGKERVYIAIAMTLQAINIVLLIAAASTDIFQVDGTRVIQNGVDLMGFPSPVAYTLTKVEFAFTVLAVCLSLINIIATGVAVCLQDYTAVPLNCYILTWFIILIPFLISCGVCLVGLFTADSAFIVGRKVHIKDYGIVVPSFLLMHAFFFVHYYQMHLMISVTRRLTIRTESLVTEQKHLDEEP